MRLDKVKMACEMAKLDLNQKEIAQRSGLHHMTVNSAYNGKSCTKKTAECIAKAMGLTLNQIIE